MPLCVALLRLARGSKGESEEEEDDEEEAFVPFEPLRKDASPSLQPSASCAGCGITVASHSAICRLITTKHQYGELALKRFVVKRSLA